ncbi:hypothetical protein AK812_SmicGene32845 [Symbiodinium microadriaticum]|uniref:Uncharacterized protein n=1 Tax=Symbiodinium microadriaticum TaxID=2951 RepID=A0A1Q9CT36_SYMMI|nr:hypothetical protein AK812_SmicGene32845 [Symbiodinium microadriaticum]
MATCFTHSCTGPEREILADAPDAAAGPKAGTHQGSVPAGCESCVCLLLMWAPVGECVSRKVCQAMM